MQFLLIATLLTLAIAFFTLVYPILIKKDRTESEPSTLPSEDPKTLLKELESHEDELNSGKLSREDYEVLSAELKRKLIRLKEEKPEP